MTKSHIPEWVKQELAKADEAVARGRLEQAAQPRATAAHYDARKKVVVIELANGASFAFPPSLAQGLEGASAADLSEIEITPMGTGLHWPRLDATSPLMGCWPEFLAAIAGCAPTPPALAVPAHPPRPQQPEPTALKAADPEKRPGYRHESTSRTRPLNWPTHLVIASEARRSIVEKAGSWIATLRSPTTEGSGMDCRATLATTGPYSSSRGPPHTPSSRGRRPWRSIVERAWGWIAALRSQRRESRQSQ